MIDRRTRLRWRRKLRRGQHRVEDFTGQADEHLEKHFIRRLGRLSGVKRFVFSWTALLLLLIGGLVLQTRSLGKYYLQLQPAPGGIFREGVIGTFTNANPIYASGTVDTSVSKLIFSGLLKYDQNNKLVGDLAESWTLDARERLYTVKLRPNLKWHDGRALTASDVVFTFGIIQNPDAKSPLFSSWHGIKVVATDELTITFELPSAFSAFPHSLTTGIVPKHLLESLPAAQMRSAIFNTAQPIGSGPFKWQAIEVNEGQVTAEREQNIGLLPYDNYHLGKPKLARFVLRTFKNEKSLLDSLLKQEIMAAVGLDYTPDELKNNSAFEEHNVPLTGAVFAFFNTSNEFLSDTSLRRALVLAADTKAVIGGLGFPVVVADQPFLKSHISYNPLFSQTTHNLDEANRLLDSLGWTKDPTTGLRSRGGKPLVVRLFSHNSGEYAVSAQILQRQWREAGVDVQVTLLPGSELQPTIAQHGYDILLYGVSLGADPDVFAYWHSTQADVRATNRLNFSEYKSDIADQSLEAGRTRSDPGLRAAKYRQFSEAWKNDHPALALYQPRFLYIVRLPLYNFEPTTMNQSSDRYNNVHNWMIRQTRNTK